MIAPNISVTIECSSLEFYCEPVSLVPLTLLSAVVSGQTDICEMIAVTTALNYMCSPGEQENIASQAAYILSSSHWLVSI